MANLWSKVFYADIDTKTVRSGRVITQTISTTGYILNTLALDDGTAKDGVFSAFLHETEEGAKDFLDKTSSVFEERNKISDEANEKIRAINNQVIGDPEFPDIKTEEKDGTTSEISNS